MFQTSEILFLTYIEITSQVKVLSSVRSNKHMLHGSAVRTDYSLVHFNSCSYNG